MSDTPSNYSHVLTELKQKIKSAKIGVVQTLNRKLLELYWEIGTVIISEQKKEGWGSKIIDRLVADLRSEFPDITGLSIRNVKYMRAFAESYPDFLIVQPSVAQLKGIDNQYDVKVQLLAAQLPWTHNLILIDKVKDIPERVFYMQKSIEHGWTKNALSLQIESNLYARIGKAITNFNHTLPASQADLAIEMLKNPYVFEFVGITEEMKERDLENALLAQMKNFFLELGRGFTFAGNQYRIVVDEKEFFIDLLFYNTKIHCYVVFELKIGEFEPEFASKLNFYVSAIDAQLRGPEDKPTIGVLLCKTPNKTIVEYSLKGFGTPLGIAEYELRKVLPEELKSEIPSLEELEKELKFEMEIIESPLKTNIEKIKGLVRNLKNEKVQEKLSREASQRIMTQFFQPFYKEIENIVEKELGEMFEGYKIVMWYGPVGYHTFEEVYNKVCEHPHIMSYIKLELEMQGFKDAGINTFNVGNALMLEFGDYKYIMSFEKYSDTKYIKLYHQILTANEIRELAITFCKLLTEEIAKRLEHIKE